MAQTNNLKAELHDLMLNVLWLLFSFKGRITREAYWLGNILLTMVVFNIQVYLSRLYELNEINQGQISNTELLESIITQILQNNSNVFLILPILVIALGWSSLAILAKRAHDQNITGWVALTIFIPIQFFPILVMIFFGVIKGNSSPNKYGNVANIRQ